MQIVDTRSFVTAVGGGCGVLYVSAQSTGAKRFYTSYHYSVVDAERVAVSRGTFAQPQRRVVLTAK